MGFEFKPRKATEIGTHWMKGKLGVLNSDENERRKYRYLLNIWKYQVLYTALYRLTVATVSRRFTNCQPTVGLPSLEGSCFSQLQREVWLTTVPTNSKIFLPWFMIMQEM